MVAVLGRCLLARGPATRSGATPQVPYDAGTVKEVRVLDSVDRLRGRRVEAEAERHRVASR